MMYRGQGRLPDDLATLRKSKLREILSDLNARAMVAGVATETTVGVWRRHDLVNAIRRLDKDLRASELTWRGVSVTFKSQRK